MVATHQKQAVRHLEIWQAASARHPAAGRAWEEAHLHPVLQQAGAGHLTNAI